MVRPASINMAYSAGPNLITSSASGGDRKEMPMTPTVPAKNEPMPAMPSAAPARPLRAIS